MNRTNRTQYPPASGTTTAPPVTRDLTTAVDPTFIPDESDDPQRKSAPRYTLKRPEASAPDQPKPRTTAGPSPPTFKGERSVGAYACCRTNLEGTVHVGEALVLAAPELRSLILATVAIRTGSLPGHILCATRPPRRFC